MDGKKATGFDEISSKFLKIGATPLAGPISWLINLSILEYKCPDILKYAGVNALLKRIDELIKENYRPFSVLTAVSTRPTLERRLTLGRLRSIYPDMINHFASQSQTCQLLIFFTFKGNCENWCNLRSNWWASTSNLKFPFSDSFKYKWSSTLLSIRVVYNGHVKHIFTLCHSRQINVATWFLVFPIDIENKSTIKNINIYMHI